jgi:HlyD family secretion protein
MGGPGGGGRGGQQQGAPRGSDGRQRVWLIQDGKTVERMIKTGLSDGQKTEVLEGVEEGEAVIIGLGSSKGNSTSGSPRLRL